MIKGLTHTGQYLQVTGGSPINPYIPPGGQSAGIVRYNTNMNTMEVYDGQNWKEISNCYASVSLTPDAESLLDWARKKREEEQAMWISNGDHPAVKAAKENFNRAKAEMMRAEDQLKATLILSKEDNESTS